MDSVLAKAKALTSEVLQPGGLAVDATLGNGHDACHLAALVGPRGQLYGVDIQPEAITSSHARLVENGLADQAVLIEGDHSELTALLPNEIVGRVDAVMFNLGYLPGGDHKIITRPENTIPALEAALKLLRPGGRITVVMYIGHAGGKAEYNKVMNWAAKRDQTCVEVLHYRFINQVRCPPELLVFERKKD